MLGFGSKIVILLSLEMYEEVTARVVNMGLPNHLVMLHFVLKQPVLLISFFFSFPFLLFLYNYIESNKITGFVSVKFDLLSSVKGVIYIILNYKSMPSRCKLYLVYLNLKITHRI